MRMLGWILSTCVVMFFMAAAFGKLVDLGGFRASLDS